MINIESEYRTIAAYALFYQCREKNISTLDIIKRFIKVALMYAKTKELRVAEIKSLINTHIGLDVPTAVLMRALHDCDFIGQPNKSASYTIIKDIPLTERDDYEDDVRTITDHTNNILDKLAVFIADRRGKTLEAAERIMLQSDLAHILLKKKGNDGFKPYIQKFIEENRDNQDVIRILQEVSIGLIVTVPTGWDSFSDVHVSSEAHAQNPSVFLSTG